VIVEIIEETLVQEGVEGNETVLGGITQIWQLVGVLVLGVTENV
jgi:hypothetical protein